MWWGELSSLGNRGRRARAAAALLIAGAVAGPASAAAGSTLSRQVRLGELPRLASGARVIGALAASAPLHITVALMPRDPTALAAFAQAVSTPGSSVYRDYLTPAQFAQRFGATNAEVAAVSASLRAHGLRPAAVTANHLSIEVSAPAAQIERAFSLTFQRMSLVSGKQAVVPSAAPALDRSIAGDVQGVIGLSSLFTPQPLDLRPGILRPQARSRLASRAQPHVATGGPQPCQPASSAARSMGAYTADQIASAYQFSGLYGSGAQGQGETIALYELEPNDPADIAAYQACYGTNAPVSYVQVAGGAGSGPGMGEAALDIEQAIGLAPKASFIVYQAPNANQNSPGSGPYQLFSTIFSQDRAQVVSVSWGECEQMQGSSDVQAEATLFQEAAAQGQSVVSATGDQGSEDCNQGNGLPDTSLAVDDPGSQQYITGVGGTTLSSIGPAPTETVWNNGGNATAALGIQGGAGGGGVSQIWAMPSYQSGAPASVRVIGANSSGRMCGNSGGYCRQVPDVSADADPNTGYIVYYNGQNSDPTQPHGWQSIGGTSAGAPVWAALLADADSSSACHGTAIGFANPALYRAAATSYSADFNDITSGNNDFTANHGGLYSAGPGYDMASGLGTPNAAALASTLCADALHVSNPGARISTVGQPVDVQIGTSVPSGGKLSFSASNLPAGLSISRSSGRVTGKPKVIGTSSVTVTATDGALTLRPAAFTWQVVGAPTISGLSLSGVSSGHPKLALAITAGRDAPALASASIGLPKGFSFGSVARRVTVTGQNGERVRFTSKVASGRLLITLAGAAQRIRVAVGAAAIIATGGLSANVHRRRALTLSIKTTDASGQTVTMSPQIKPRG
jgi:subtilase family serine protease